MQLGWVATTRSPVSEEFKTFVDIIHTYIYVTKNIIAVHTIRKFLSPTRKCIRRGSGDACFSFFKALMYSHI